MALLFKAIDYFYYTRLKWCAETLYGRGKYWHFFKDCGFLIINMTTVLTVKSALLVNTFDMFQNRIDLTRNIVKLQRLIWFLTHPIFVFLTARSVATFFTDG